VELEESEFELDESDELLWRQIHSSWIDGKSIAKSAFMPGKKDEGKLSLARSSEVSAEDSHAEYVAGFGYKSEGVMAVRVAECDGENVRVVDDSSSASRPDPCPKGHCYADLRSTGSSRLKKVAANLRDHAVSRGWVHRIPEE
jgi:hypothetical protein